MNSGISEYKKGRKEKMKKKLLTLMTMLVTMFQLSITAFTAPVADVKQGMESKVFVSGSLGEKYAGKSVTMLVVADGRI